MSLEILEQQLKAVADANRLKIMAALKNGELCVCHIVGFLEISQPAVSQQIKKLKEAGIIEERKEGTWKYYRLADLQQPVIQQVLDELQILELKRGRASSCS